MTIYNITQVPDGDMGASREPSCKCRPSCHAVTSPSDHRRTPYRPSIWIVIVCALLCAGLGLTCAWCWRLHVRVLMIGENLERLQADLETIRRTLDACSCCKYNESSIGSTDVEYDPTPDGSDDPQESSMSQNDDSPGGSMSLKSAVRLKRNSKHANKKKSQPPDHQKTKKPPIEESRKKNQNAIKGFRLNGGKDLAIQNIAHTPAGKRAIVGWRMADWSVRTFGQHYSNTTGRFSVQEKGLYLIYAQIIYHTVSPFDGYAVMTGNDVIAKCLVSVDHVDDASDEAVARFKTCHVTIVQRLDRLQDVWLRNLDDEEDRLLHYADDHSNFWGMVKLAD